MPKRQYEAVPPERYPDAILAPRPYKGQMEAYDYLVDQFRAILGPDIESVHIASLPSLDYYFISGGGDNTINHAITHPLANMPRYDWFMVAETDSTPACYPQPIAKFDSKPKSIRFGYLRDETADSKVPLFEQATFNTSWFSDIVAMQPKWNRFNQLAGKLGALTPDEKKEYMDLKAEVLPDVRTYTSVGK